jgi:hypothetical protein
MRWIDPAMLVEPTGYGVRGEHRSAGDAKSLPDPDAIAVAPAAFNAEHPAFPPSLRERSPAAPNPPGRGPANPVVVAAAGRGFTTIHASLQ